MSFSLPISSPIGRHQELTNQRLCPQTIISKLTVVSTSHSNAQCKSMFGLFMIKQIRTNDVRRDCSVFLARLFPAISGTCRRINHHWPKSEARLRNNEDGTS